MKKFLRLFTSIAVVSLLCFVVTSTADARLPTSFEDYKLQAKEGAKTPEGTVLLWLEGCILYSQPQTRTLGRDILVDITDKLPKDFEKNAAHSTFVNRLKTEPQTFRSYCKGATPENGYKTDLDKCELTVTKSEEDPGGGWQVHIKSNGADTPRKLTLTKGKEGNWKIVSYPGLYMGVRPIVKE
ncbi:MAG: hypothetical protein WC966_03705 [Bradymonadales bacterium]|jgi:hypothetical protein